MVFSRAYSFVVGYLRFNHVLLEFNTNGVAMVINSLTIALVWAVD